MVKIRVSPAAYMKMSSLVMGFDKEVGWFGTCEEVGDLDFRIKDILVFPQYTSGCYVDDEQDDPLEFRKWLDTLSDDDYNSRRLWGHSHVEMGTSPSGTDTSMFKRFAQGAAAAEINKFAIAVIVNKKGEMNWWCYDSKTDKEYSNKDIDIQFEIEEGLTNVEWFNDVKTLVRDLGTMSSFEFMFGKPSQAKSSISTNIIKGYGAHNYTGSKNNNQTEKTEDGVEVDKSKELIMFEDENYYPFQDYGDIFNPSYTAKDFKVFIGTKQNVITEVDDVSKATANIFPAIVDDIYMNRYAIGVTDYPIETDNPLAKNDSLAMTLYDHSNDGIDYFVVDFESHHPNSDDYFCPTSEEEVERLMAMTVKDEEVTEDDDAYGITNTILWITVEDIKDEHE